MIIKSLTVENVGPYAGRHVIQLEPSTDGKVSKDKPIILISGLNGSGKTTLLQAVKLCLQGKRGSEHRTNAAYDKFLTEFIHQPGTGKPISAASISLEISKVDSGMTEEFTIIRSWHIDGGSIKKSLRITQDDEDVPYLASEQYQSFLDELVPTGITDFFFFDGERIQRLAEQDETDIFLANSIRHLLGLDLTEKLKADLTYIMRTRNGSLPVSQVENDAVELQDQISERDSVIEKLEQEFQDSDVELEGIDNDIRLLEQNIASEGGGFAQRRQEMLAAQTRWRTILQQSQGALREIAVGLLPFGLSPRLTGQLRESLRNEAVVRVRADAEKMIRTIESKFRDLTGSPNFWLQQLGIDLSTEQAKKIQSELSKILKSEVPASNNGKGSRVHDLSGGDEEHLMNVLTREVSAMQGRTRQLVEEISTSTSRLRKIERELQKAPKEDVLKPLLDKLRALNSRMTIQNKHVEAKESELKSHVIERNQLISKLDKLEEGIRGLTHHGQKMTMMAKVRNVLIAYEQELSIARVQELGEQVSKCLKMLAHKKTFGHVSFDPITFNLSLFDSDGKVVPKSRLSAGEKQILAVSVLWGLEVASGKRLPVIIDTPLARLDKSHRRSFINNYFPKASSQVILLATDSEIDDQALNALKPWMSKSYQLRYDSNNKRTTVENGHLMPVA